MVQSNMDFMTSSEMSLDEWVDVTLAPVADMIYFISSTISRLMDSLKLDRG